jgi:hypothetical protein
MHSGHIGGQLLQFLVACTMLDEGNNMMDISRTKEVSKADEVVVSVLLRADLTESSTTAPASTKCRAF